MEKESQLKPMKVGDDGENVALNAIASANTNDSRFDDNLFEDNVVQLDSQLRILPGKHKKKALS